MRYISPRGVELVGPIGRTTLKCALCRQKAHSRPQHPCLRSYERAAESASRSVTQHDSSSEQRDIQVPVGTDTLSFPKSSSSSSGTRNSWTIWFGTSSGASAVRVSDGVHSILRSMERARRVQRERGHHQHQPLRRRRRAGVRVPREQPAGRQHAKAGQRERWPTATS